MPLIVKKINTFIHGKNGPVDVTTTHDHAPKAPRAVWVHFAECIIDF